MKIRSLYLPSALLSTALLAACGGGSSSSSSSQTAPAAVFTAQNYTAVAAQAWTASELFLSANDGTKTGSNSGGGASNSVSMIDQMNTIFNVTSTAAKGFSATSQSFSDNCPNGGSFSGSLNLSVPNSFAAGSKLEFSATNCTIEGAYLDGKFNLNLLESSASSTTLNIAFSNLSLLGGDSKVNIDGDSQIIATGSKYNINGKRLHFTVYSKGVQLVERTLNNYAYVQDASLGLQIKGDMVAKSTKLGSISYTVETKQPIVKATDGYPAQGGIVVVSAGGSTVTVTTLGGDQVQVDYSANGSSKIDATSTLSWQKLMEAAG